MNNMNMVKGCVDLVKEISEKVTLIKRVPEGKYLKGNCPFKSDCLKNSFTVSPEKKVYYCFGCHESGDVISWVCKINNISPVEAVELLIEKHKIRHLQTSSYEAIYETKEEALKSKRGQSISAWIDEDLMHMQIYIIESMNELYTKENLEIAKLILHKLELVDELITGLRCDIFVGND
jgi:DNA primase